MKWWPYYNGHYLLNKGTDLTRLFNEHDSDKTMDMIDSLLIADSLYDDEHGGGVIKKRLLLDKDYQRNRQQPQAISDDYGVDPAAAFSNGPIEYLELGEDGIAPGLDPRIQPMG